MFSELGLVAETNFPPLLCASATGRLLHPNSRQVKQGDIFVACQGGYTDGRSYIPVATVNGAVFVFWDDGGKFEWNPEWEVPNQGIEDLKYRAGMLAMQVCGNVSDDLKVWGIASTSGKASITQWPVRAADLLDEKTIIIGTVGNGFQGVLEETAHTAPVLVDIQTLLYRFHQQGTTAAAMEVSSHNLDQLHVNGVSFCSTIFTNLARDRLDYHDTMEAYGAIKSRLFYRHGLRHAVINIDDEYDAELAGRLKKDCPGLAVYSYGFNEHANIRITHFTASSNGMEAVFQTPWGEGRCRTRLPGRFSAQDLAACIALLCANGYPLDKVLDMLVKIRPASDHMDRIMNSGKPLVVIDYAHTSDALEEAPATSQEVEPQGAALWYVFGCGGNRDRGKRPLMGVAAVQGADKVVVTSDNPRLENPRDVINNILPVVPVPECVETDRATAIHYTIERTAPSDIISITDKGHGNYQDIQGIKHRFSGLEVAEKVLTEWIQQRVPKFSDGLKVIKIV